MLRVKARFHEDPPPFGQVNLHRAAVSPRNLRRRSLNLNLDELFLGGPA
jgi:hypothetical protein